MAGPVDRIVQSVPLRCKVVPKLWVSPLFLKVKVESMQDFLLGVNLPPAQRVQ